MLPSYGVEILEYLDLNGRSPYATWFVHLNAQAAARVVVAVTRLAQGNMSNVKGVGLGVYEYRGSAIGTDTRLQRDDPGASTARSQVSQRTSARRRRMPPLRRCGDRQDGFAGLYQRHRWFQRAGEKYASFAQESHANA